MVDLTKTIKLNSFNNLKKNAYSLININFDIKYFQFVLLSSQLIGLSYSMNLDGASTGYFLDVLMKSQQKNEKTSCDSK